MNRYDIQDPDHLEDIIQENDKLHGQISQANSLIEKLEQDLEQTSSVSFSISVGMFVFGFAVCVILYDLGVLF